jgi:hypothetical protein
MEKKRPPMAYLIFIPECDPKNKFCIDANATERLLGE